MRYDRETAGFIIAVYICDLTRWASDGYDDLLADAFNLADNLGVRERVDSELDQLGWSRPVPEVALPEVKD